MILKKIALALLAAVMLLTGCSSGNKSLNIDAAGAAKQIYDDVTFRDSLIKAENLDVAENYYPGLRDISTDFAIYISGSGATAEEIAVLKVKSGVDTDAAEDILYSRIEKLKFQFEDYVPEEMVKLGDPVIEVKSDVVIMVICDDSAAAAKKVTEILSQSAK